MTRIDVFFISFFRKPPGPIAYLGVTLLGALMLPLVICGGAIWAVVFALHAVGDKAVRSMRAAVQGRVVDDD